MRRVAIDLWLDSLFSGGSTNFDINCYTQFCSSSKQWKGGVKSGQTILDLQVGIGWNNHMFISINPFFLKNISFLKFEPALFLVNFMVYWLPSSAASFDRKQMYFGRATVFKRTLFLCCFCWPQEGAWRVIKPFFMYC